MTDISGPFQPREGDIIIRFGAGLNTRSSTRDIDDQECSAGENYDLDLDNRNFRRRNAFSLVATATNTSDIRGFMQLRKIDGTITTLVQAGTAVYDWDGASSFTSVGTVNANSKLRSVNWVLDEKAIITDLARIEVVKEWDGTTLSDISHNLGGDFKAKYAIVENDRVFYANVETASATPHVIVGSKREDYDNLSITDRPASTANAEDAFFVTAPDLRPINGLGAAFGRKVFSTEKGSIYQLTGQDKTDFQVDQFYDGSFAAGDEAIVPIGNDVAIGSDGRIETLLATETLGDVETDDLTRKIIDDVQDVTDWKIVFNRRLQKIYCFPNALSKCFVMHKALVDDTVRRVSQRREAEFISPWSVWTTRPRARVPADHRPTSAKTI